MSKNFSLIKVLFAVLLFCHVSTCLPAFSQEKQTDINEKEEFDFANGLFSRGMYDMAVEGYETFLKNYPKSMHAKLVNYRIGESYFLNKQYKEALTWFEGFVKKYPSGDLTIRAVLREGQAYFLSGDYPRAESALSSLAARENAPEEIKAAAWYYIARIYLEQKDYKKAEETLQKLVRDFSGNEYMAFAHMNLGDIYLRAKDFKKAADSYEAAATSSTVEDVTGQAELRAGDAYHLAGDYQKARSIYKKLIDGSQNPAVFDNAAAGLVSSLYNEAKYQQVIDDSDSLLSKVKSGEIKARMLFILGNSLFHENRFPEAEKVYRDAALEYPDTEFGRKARLNECWALYEAGNLEKSLSSIDSYLADTATGSKDEGLFLKAKVLSKLGRASESIDTYEKLMKEFKESNFYKEALYETGWLYDEAARPEEAIAYYKKFVDTYPKDERSPEILLKMGQNNLKLGRYKQAEEDYRLFLSRYGDSPLKENVLYQLGNVYIETKDYTALITTYEQFLKEFPDSEVKDSVIYWIGRGFQQKEDWDRAMGYYSKTASDKEGRFYVASNEAMAYCLYRKGEDKKSADVNYKLMTERPDHVMPEESYRWVADYYFNNGQSERSLEVLQFHEKNYPGSDVDGAVSYMAGENLRRLGQLEKAEAYFNRVIKKGVSSVYLGRSYVGLGRCYLAQGKDTQALSSLEEALKFHEDNIAGAYARYEIGNLKYKMGEYEEAAKAYTMVAILYEDKDLCPEALFKAGESFQKAGMPEKSAEMFKELVKRYPDNPLATKAGEELKGSSGEEGE